MRKHLLSFAIISSMALSAQPQETKGYQLTFNIKGVDDTVAYLAYFYGKGQFYRDTAEVATNGDIVFVGKDTLQHGMYSLIASNSKVFDFVVDRQVFSATSDQEDIVQHMEFKNSPENKVFYAYLKFLNSRQQKAKEISQEIQTTQDPEKRESLQNELSGLDEEVQSYLDKFHKENAGSLPSNFIKSLKYPEIPIQDANSEIPDSVYALYYFKNHFFDDFDFSDDRLVRTPSFHDKIDYYLDKLTYQQADSINNSLDVILGKSKESKELFKYALSYLTSKYERSDKMGMDAVFVHLVQNYFAKGMANEWYKEKDLKKLVDKANKLEPLLIGKKAPNLILKDTSQTKIIQLYDIDAKYTVVYIWSPTCGHCKTATPKLLEVYHKYKDQGVEVYAVNEKFENKEWLEFIREHQLDFINVGDGGDFVSNFRELYDVFSTPETYLLDENKKILAKKMSVESLDEMLDFYINKKRNKKK